MSDDDHRLRCAERVTSPGRAADCLQMTLSDTRAVRLTLAILIAAALLAAAPPSDADQLGEVRLAAPEAGGYYDALSGTTATVTGPSRLSVRPRRLGFRVLGVGVSTSMSRLRWTGWGTARATARGEARFCPDLGVCTTMTGVLVVLRRPERTRCDGRKGDWITLYTRMTARLSPGVAPYRLSVETTRSVTC